MDQEQMIAVLAPQCPKGLEEAVPWKLQLWQPVKLGQAPPGGQQQPWQHLLLPLQMPQRHRHQRMALWCMLRRLLLQLPSQQFGLVERLQERPEVPSARKCFRIS